MSFFEGEYNVKGTLTRALFEPNSNLWSFENGSRSDSRAAATDMRWEERARAAQAWKKREKLTSENGLDISTSGASAAVIARG
jgi:hypothetical protein